MSYRLEICAGSVQSCINAQKGGADRVELCDNLWEGGTTPSSGMIKTARAHINIGLYVIVRPRGGDFLYDEVEFEVIKEDIRMAKELGADGIVSGILDADGNVDTERSRALVELSRPLPFTFHRAFDLTSDPFEALEDIISIGAARILTSGQRASVSEGMDMLRRVNDKAAGRIIIMPGGGITDKNAAETAEKTGCTEFHMSGRTVEDSRMRFRSHGIKINGAAEIPEYDTAVSGVDKIKAVRNVLKW